MANIILVVVLLVFVFNFFVLYMCAKRWRIVHVLFTFFLFVASIAFMVFTAASLKTRMAWENAVQTLEKDLEKAQDDEIKLRYGDLGKAPEAFENTIVGAKAAVAQEQFDRGRIWSGCAPERFDGRAVVVRTSDPSAADAATRSNNIKEKTILHAFKERVWVVEEAFKRPYLYLGEFVATAVTDNTVTLAPVLPLDQGQITAINTADTTWVLYEVLPVDRHELFQGEDGRPYDRNKLSKEVLLTEDKKLLDPYVYSHLPIREIEALDKEFKPPVENVWFKVRFLKEHTEEVDSTDAPAADKTLFDSQGRALPLSLRQQSATTFKVGDFGLFDPETAARLMADGTCEKVDEIYVRPLQNYEQHFHEYDKRNKQLTQRMAAVAIDTANTMAAKANAVQQVDSRQKELDNLKSDSQHVSHERAEVIKYRGELEAALATKRAELSELYRANLLLAAELAGLQKKIADDLNKPSTTGLDSSGTP